MACRLLIRESIKPKIGALQEQESALGANLLGEKKFPQTLTLGGLRFLVAD
jgi:hypothetical protein